jgi:hypothetical protein
MKDRRKFLLTLLLTGVIVLAVIAAIAWSFRKAAGPRTAKPVSVCGKTNKQ